MLIYFRISFVLCHNILVYGQFVYRPVSNDGYMYAPVCLPVSDDSYMYDPWVSYPYLAIIKKWLCMI